MPEPESFFPEPEIFWPKPEPETKKPRSLHSPKPFTLTKLENTLVKNNRTILDKVAPNAFRIMKRRGCVKSTMVKPQLQAFTKKLFIVKARVNATMESMSYDINLNQSREVDYGTCSCNLSQCGCWKHVAALT